MKQQAPPSNKPTQPSIADHSRFITVGLYPEAKPRRPFIRLCGLWLEQAEFKPQSRIRVRVMPGCLVLTVEN